MLLFSLTFISSVCGNGLRIKVFCSQVRNCNFYAYCNLLLPRAAFPHGVFFFCLYVPGPGAMGNKTARGKKQQIKIQNIYGKHNFLMSFSKYQSSCFSIYCCFSLQPSRRNITLCTATEYIRNRRVYSA